MRFNWENLLYLVTVPPIMYVFLLLVGAMIPYEEVPRVQKGANGTTLYAIQSSREAVLWPVGTVLFWVLTIGFAYKMFRYKCEYMAADTELSLLRRCLGWTLCGVIVVPFVLVTLAAVVINPYRYYHKATVGPEKIVLSSLYWSWTIPRSDVQDAKFLRETQIEAHKRRFYLRFLITTKDQKTFKSALLSGLSSEDPALKKYETMFKRLEEDLRRGNAVNK